MSERCLLSSMVISEAAVWKAVLDHFTLRDIRKCLCYFLSQTKASYRAGTMESVSQLLRGQRQWIPSFVFPLKRRGGHSSKDCLGPGQRGRGTTYLPPHSSHYCSGLWRLLDALPSLRLSRQSLAVSALSRVCSPSGNALMADDELMRIVGCNQ